MKNKQIILGIFLLVLMVSSVIGGIYYIKRHYKPYELDAMMPFVRVEETQHTKSYYFRDGTIHRYLAKDGEDFKLIQESQEVYGGGAKIAILYIATGRYIRFWDRFYKSAEKNFLPRHQKTYFLFTDSEDLDLPKNVVRIYKEQEDWPNIVLKRYHIFSMVLEQLKDFDYIYFMNANTLVGQPVNEEIFPSKEQGFMVTLHPGYWLEKKNEKIPYERNMKSKTGVAKDDDMIYVYGAFNGFRKDSFLQIFGDLKEMLDEDMKNNIIPVWHDESALNKYVVEYMKRGKKPLILLPNYMIPEQGWGSLKELNPYVKMIILDKRKYGGHKWLRENDKE